MVAVRAVGIKVLKDKLSEYVRLAATGETVLVVDRDRVVAELTAPRAGRAEELHDAELAEVVRKAHSADHDGSRPAAAATGDEVGRAASRPRPGSRGPLIYVDTSVVLAHLLSEDRPPPQAMWRESLVSSRLLVYEAWNRVNRQRCGLAQCCAHAGAREDRLPRSTRGRAGAG